MSSDPTESKIQTFYCAEKPIIPYDGHSSGFIFHAPSMLFKNLAQVMASQDGPVEVFEVQVISRGFFRRKYEIERCDPPEKISAEKEVEKIFQDIEDYDEN